MIELLVPVDTRQRSLLAQAPIRRSAWKANSPKSISTMLHRTREQEVSRSDRGRGRGWCSVAEHLLMGLLRSWTSALRHSQTFDREDLSNVRAFERITSTASSRESLPMSVSHTNASMPIVAPIP